MGYQQRSPKTSGPYKPGVELKVKVPQEDPAVLKRTKVPQRGGYISYPPQLWHIASVVGLLQRLRKKSVYCTAHQATKKKKHNQTGVFFLTDRR
jgi:hypothetical protein